MNDATILEAIAAGANLAVLRQRFGYNAAMAVLIRNGFTYNGDVIIKRAEPEPPPVAAEEPKPVASPAIASKPKTTPEERAANKAHKLSAEMPSSVTLVPGRGWRRYPGMPEILINKHQIAVVQKQSRRLGVHYVLVPRYGFKGREAWHYWKKGKRTVIFVKRAMYECGFWKPRAKVVG